MKSFDAKISGKCNGWIFAKMTYSHGGHQDNVFEEAHHMCEWILKFGNVKDIYVILIDTDLNKEFNELKVKYHKNNLFVGNHIELQKHFIEKYL